MGAALPQAQQGDCGTKTPCRVAHEYHCAPVRQGLRCAHRSRLSITDADGNVEVTADGNMLVSLYTDQDLLTSECIREGVWQGLTPPELAGAAAALVFESRSPDEGGVTPPLPRSPALRAALAEQLDLAADLAERESRHHVNFVRQPNPGFSMAAWSWAHGNDLTPSCATVNSPPAIFVRWCRQLIDLMAQIAEAAPERELRANARSAMDGLRRGVVSYTGVEANELAGE